MNGLVIALVGMAALVNAGPKAKLTQAPQVIVRKDVEYGVEQGESLKLNLFLPNAPLDGRPAPRPGLIFIHGGGWVGGDKNDYNAYAEETARLGYVAISVNYRLAPKYRFPAALQDVQRAVRWLRSHAKEYKIDPERIGAIGASAGGHLASFLGVHDTWDPGAGADAPSSRVNCVVDYFGRADLTLPLSPKGHDYRPDFLGKSGTDALPAYREASPITYVDSHTVPFLIIQGTRDPQVGPEQSQHFLAALDNAGIESSLLLLSGQGHGFQGAAEKQAWTAAKAFLAAHLRTF